MAITTKKREKWNNASKNEIKSAKGKLFKGASHRKDRMMVKIKRHVRNVDTNLCVKHFLCKVRVNERKSCITNKNIINLPNLFASSDILVELAPIVLLRSAPSLLRFALTLLTDPSSAFCNKASISTLLTLAFKMNLKKNEGCSIYEPRCPCVPCPPICLS